MSEKKDPHPENNPVDFDDNEDIIELTDEVIVKPKEDDENVDLQNTDAPVPDTLSDLPLKTDGKEPKFDDGDDIFDLGGTAETDSLENGPVVDLNEAFADDENAMEEDDIIASAIEESLGADDEDLEEDRINLTEEADTSAAKNDEAIIFDNEDDEPDALSEPAVEELEKDGGIFETEEEIELEYESDEDEYDFFALDDKKPLEDLETITMADEDPDDAGDDDFDFGPVPNLDIDSGEDDEIIAMDTEPPVKPDLLAFDDEETLEFEEIGDLPDLTDEMEFEFDDGDDENGFADSDDQITEDSDDIIARAVEKSLAPDEVIAQIDLAMEPEFEFTEDSDTVAEEDEPVAGEDLAATTAEEILKLAAVDDLPDIDDDIDLEFEDEDDGTDIENFGNLESEVENLSIEELEDITAEEEDIIEITEFDEHFPAEDEKRLERAGILDASDSDEDDFLELIEVEEDDTAEDEEAIKFNNSEEQSDGDEIDNFFSETIEDEPEFENDEMEPLEDTPVLNTDMAMATAPPADEDEEFDFSLDSSDISQQVDRLDTFFSDDPATEPDVASLPAEPLAEEATEDENQPAVEDAIESLSVTPDQIDSIIERVIKDKIGGNIENIIYEIIEKAVSKEIDRLKGALLDHESPGDGNEE
ncbi:hypothetical protein N9219_02405 [bacterium]|nr:hypothetical protein [bacterium]